MSNSVDTTVFWISVIIGMLGVIITTFCWFIARQMNVINGNFGWSYGIFTVLLVSTTVFWAYFPGVEKGPQLMKQMYIWMMRGIVIKMVEFSSQPPAAISASIGLPTGSPSDYVEWRDHGHIRPKMGVSLPPAGWRIAFTLDPTKIGKVVNTVVDVPEGEVWLFFDPDLTVLPSTTPPLSLEHLPSASRP